MEFQFADILECLCDARPDGDVLVAGAHHCTRRELDVRANRLAHHLLGHGLGRGDHIGIYAYNRIEWVEGLLACWKIGACAININFRYVSDELRYIWQNSDMVALIYERSFADRVAELAPEFPAIKSYLVLEDGSEEDATALGLRYEDALALQSDARDFAPRSGDDIHFVYTGGTTGMPKGVLWRHEDWYLNLAHYLSPKVEKPEDIALLVDNPLGMRTLTLSPLMHGGGQYTMMLTLFNGGVGLFPVSRRFDPHEVLDIIEESSASTLSIIGDAMARPIAEARLDPSRPHDTTALKAISSGGAILTAPVRELLREAFGKIFITGGIGSSEIGAAARETQKFDSRSGPRFRLDGGVAVLDDELRQIQPGSPRTGRLARSGNIPIGYYKDEAKTAATFVTDPDGMRWVIPGDHAKVEEDGTITLLGRGSECINSGGEKIFADEVEGVVCGHPAVRYASVVGVPDPKWMQRVVVLVELQEGFESLSLAELQTHCRRHLAGYKIPQRLAITPLERTPTGKVDTVWARDYAEKKLGASS